MKIQSGRIILALAIFTSGPFAHANAITAAAKKVVNGAEEASESALVRSIERDFPDVLDATKSAMKKIVAAAETQLADKTSGQVAGVIPYDSNRGASIIALRKSETGEMKIIKIDTRQFDRPVSSIEVVEPRGRVPNYPLTPDAHFKEIPLVTTFDSPTGQKVTSTEVIGLVKTPTGLAPRSVIHNVEFGDHSIATWQLDTASPRKGVIYYRDQKTANVIDGRTVMRPGGNLTASARVEVELPSNVDGEILGMDFSKDGGTFTLTTTNGEIVSYHVTKDEQGKWVANLNSENGKLDPITRIGHTGQAREVVAGRQNISDVPEGLDFQPVETPAAQ